MISVGCGVDGFLCHPKLRCTQTKREAEGVRSDAKEPLQLEKIVDP